ncbi:MAG: PRC-barrel domain-containing protein [Thermodesulfovibrionales bacterium]
MPLFGELFVSEILGEPVLDPRGEELGRLKDLIIVKADPLPKVSAIILERKKRPYMIEWASLELFNKRIITARILSSELRPYDMTSPDLLAVRDLLDKQIVDVNGVKVVRVKDAEDIQELLGHDEDTAGGLMTNEFIVYPPDMTVQEVLNRFKEDASEIETVYYDLYH